MILFFGWKSCIFDAERLYTRPAYGGNAVLLHLLVVSFIRYRNKKKLINRTN